MTHIVVVYVVGIVLGLVFVVSGGGVLCLVVVVIAIYIGPRKFGFCRTETKLNLFTT